MTLRPRKNDSVSTRRAHAGHGETARSPLGRIGRAPAALTLAAALPLAFAQTASAQWERGYQPDEHYEYEPDEGWHEEEWYDPTDWFDDRPYDYEYDDYSYEAYQYDGHYYDSDEDSGWFENEDRFDNNDRIWYGEDRDADLTVYYRGYAEGYDDDDFGIDSPHVASA